MAFPRYVWEHPGATIPDTRVDGRRFGLQLPEGRALDGLRVWGSGFRALGFSVWGLAFGGLGVQDWGLRVQDFHMLDRWFFSLHEVH